MEGVYCEGGFEILRSDKGRIITPRVANMGYRKRYIFIPFLRCTLYAADVYGVEYDAVQFRITFIYVKYPYNPTTLMECRSVVRRDSLVGEKNSV